MTCSGTAQCGKCACTVVYDLTNRGAMEKWDQMGRTSPPPGPQRHSLQTQSKLLQVWEQTVSWNADLPFVARGSQCKQWALCPDEQHESSGAPSAHQTCALTVWDLLLQQHGYDSHFSAAAQLKERHKKFVSHKNSSMRKRIEVMRLDHLRD